MSEARPLPAPPALALALALALAGCFAPPFPDAPVAGSGHGHGGAGAAGGHHSDPALDAAQGIVLTAACFEVSVPGDAATSWIHGTLYEPLARNATTVVVLVPGGASFAHIFDGESFGYGRDNGTTLPRFLARHGYATLVIDRLGLGLSPYAGHGSTLTAESGDGHVVTIVSGLRSGGYTSTTELDSVCPLEGGPGPAFERVVLGGQSLGGSVVMRHAVSASEPADGYLVFGMINRPLGNAPSKGPTQGIPVATPCFKDQAVDVAATGYLAVLCPGPDGLAYGCFDLWMWPPATDPAVMRLFCANSEIHAEPTGSATMFNPAAFQAILARIPFASAPIHFVFGEHDCITNDGDDCADQTKTRDELADWQRDCPCDASATWIPHVGHVFQFHSDHRLVNDDVLAWLEASDLGPEAST